MIAHECKLQDDKLKYHNKSCQTKPVSFNDAAGSFKSIRHKSVLVRPSICVQGMYDIDTENNLSLSFREKKVYCPFFL